MFKFIFSKAFLINFAIAVLFAGIVIWGIFKFIDDYTLHGKTISVPSLEGVKVGEVEDILSVKKLRYIILDSIYIAAAEKGVVLEQNPLPDDLVKENRMIYVTVSKVVPPKISMPDVVDMSLRLAVAKLESYGLKVKTQHRPSECVNCVLKQEINGKIVLLNEKINKGSLVLLTVGQGTSGARVMVPYLIGLTKHDAESKLLAGALSVGFSDYEGCNCETREDTLNAKIYRQSPIRNQNVVVNMGSIVDLHFTCDTNLVNVNPPVIEPAEAL